MAPQQADEAKSKPRRLDPDELSAMVKSGAEYMANGSVGAARMMLRPAADAGDAAAAFALAEAYDPLVLEQLKAKGGITADVGLAQAWYRKARDLGSTAAQERLERLSRLPD
jgi:TPR repeat protein